jgi:hypothetical protein
MKRWTWVASGLVMPLAAVLVIAAGPRQAPAPASPQLIDNTTLFDANNLMMFVTNTGSFAYDKTVLLGKSDGLYFPKGTNKTVIFAAGFWMGGKVNGGVRTAAAEYSNDYVPGPMANGTFQTDRGSFRVYKINKGDTRETSEDYANWPFDDGAPALKAADGSDSLDAEGNRIPLLLGDQALWCVYNDASMAGRVSDPGSGSAGPLGIEVQNYVFGYARAGALGNTIFMQYKLINKGGNTIDSTHVSLWADPDLGDASDDLVGCDSTLGIGFCYNSRDDAVYGEAAPAVGFDFFQGPIVPDPGNTDTILIDGRQTEVVGYRELPMTSFNKYINGTDPSNNIETFNYMKGLERDGTPHLYNGVPTKFFMSGDPVAGTGELDNNAADRRYMMTAGPFTMNPGDTQVVVAAVIVGQGANRISSIERLRDNDRIAQAVFDANFNIPGPPPQPAVWQIPNDGEVLLLWGPQADGNVQEAYGPPAEPGGEPVLLQRFLFEGFNIYQGQSSSGPWTKIATFDENNDVTRIYNDLDNPNGKERVVVQRGTNSGLVHELRITQDRIRGTNIINNRPYYFAVTAYNYDDLNKVEFADDLGNVFGIISESFETLPKAPDEGVTPLSQTGLLVDSLNDNTTHVAGKADGMILIDYIDPNDITGDDYQITFNPSLEWTLKNQTKNSVLLSSMSSDISPTTTEGFVVRLVNPPPGMKDWDIPSGTRRFTFAGGADGAHLEGFEGAMGWSDPCYFFGNCDQPAVRADQIVNVVLRLATVDENGNFDPNDENVSYAYRYMRGANAAPAKPEFAPFIKNPAGSYAFQEFAKSVPLSAWNVDADPPVRLAVGHLENNVAGGMVDGKYWPPDFNVGNNYDVGGPREWLFVFLEEYSETANPAHQVPVLVAQPPIMYMSTAARRGNVPFSPGGTGEDEFLIMANHVFGPNDVFEFTTVPPAEADGQAVENAVSNVYPVPNPYYNLTSLELDQFRRQIKFVNLPPALTTIRIFNLAGDCVRVLTKDNPGSAELVWDVLTETGLPVASGMYIYHVEAEGIGTKIGKLAVFTEVEQLNTY